MPPKADPNAIVAQDIIDDGDSAIEGSIGDASDTTSLASNIKNHVYENGRRYHSYRHGEYILPNDDDEQDRLDLSHHIYNLILGGNLHRAPIKNAQRVLDLGTGTGIWAIDYADENPQAEVIGIDLSPIQPPWVPPNLRFEIDDFESEWDYHTPFDLIHGRELEGAIRDHDELFRRALRSLKPGGYLEMKSIAVTSSSDDGTHLKAKNVIQVVEGIHQAAEKFGKSMNTLPTWKEKMEKAGFVDVKEEVIKLPQSPWAKDPKLKQWGVFQQHNLLEGLGPYTFALFTRFLGWQKEEVEVLLSGARREIKDLTHHLYTKLYIVYGRKPDDK